MKDNPFKIQEGSVSDSKIKNFLRHRKSGDYVDVQFLKDSEHLGKFFEPKKILFLFFIFSFFLLILLSRAFYLQLIKGDYYLNIAEGNRIRSDIIKSNRGLIYDRFGEVLTKNVSYFFVYINPNLMPSDQEEKNKLISYLAEVLELDLEELNSRIYDDNKNLNRVLIYEDLAYEKAMNLMLFSESNSSIQVSFESRRQYFENLGLSHVLGYLGVVDEEDIVNGYNYNDRIGKSGIESVYENLLKGENGIRQVEVDAFYKEKNIVSVTEPIDGSDIYLTIDSKAQAKLYEIIKNNSEKYEKEKIAAVVLDPNDGGVLAMVSLPDFDNNIFTSSLDREEYSKIISDDNKPLLNRVISGEYPLGSLFKMVVAAAALEEGIINTSFTVNSTGGVTIGNNFFPDWRGSGHGRTNVYWALADSVNTFFYTIGGGNNQWLSLGLGVERITDYAKKFGFGFETKKYWLGSLLFLSERWYLGDTYNLSIGQGYLLSTPIQAVNLVSYFANSGIVYKPHFIKDIQNEEEIESVELDIALTNIVSSDNLNAIRRGLREAVKTGTAQSLQSVSVPVAGKTGTAQFNRNKEPHSWFASFAPYDEPKIAMTVLVEEGSDYGLAVKISREFMEWYFSQ